MKNMTLKQIAAACNGKLYGTYDSEKEVAGVTLDSRTVEKEDLFIAAAGARVDGHDFTGEVFDRGALAVVCERLPEQAQGPCILVDNSFEALKSIAKWYRKQLAVKVVGITGSVGKTSTKEFISSVLSQKYQVLKTEGNFNNEIGLPLTILKIRDHHEVAVLEMGINHFGEMHRLSELARPDICVITNIGECHLENLGSREGILKAKSEIFDFMSEDGQVCVNGDDDMLLTLQEVKGRRPLRFGLGIENDVFASDIVTRGLFGSTCTIHHSHSSFTAEIPLPGGHMVLNALAATAVGTVLAMKDEEIAAGIAGAKPVNGRSNIIRTDHFTIIDDCYNANPVSMKAALDLLRMADTRKVAILGDMGELGENKNALHSEVGSYAVTSGIDLLVCVGALSRTMYTAAVSRSQASEQQSPTQILYYETKEELVKALPAFLNAKDTILVKASRFMGFETVVKSLN